VGLSFCSPSRGAEPELLSGVKSDLAVKVIGPTGRCSQRWRTKIAAVWAGFGADSVKVEQISGAAQIEIVPDRQAVARYKIDLADINDLIETAVGGKVATTMVEGQMRFGVLVRFPEKDRNDLAALERLLVPAPDGSRIPLARLATIRETESPAQVSREKGMRRVVVECNIRGRDMGGFVAETQRALQPRLSRFRPAFSSNTADSSRTSSAPCGRLAVVVPVSVLLIFLMLFSALGSCETPFSCW
jgi:cobalt-zinc-cadmium resistance protein CzcA